MLICDVCGRSSVTDLNLVTGIDKINALLSAGEVIVTISIAGTSERGYPVAIMGDPHKHTETHYVGWQT